MKIAVYGAVGTGRELADIIEEPHEFVGFIDDFAVGPMIIGSSSGLPKLAKQGVKIACAIGSYKTMARRKNILGRIPEKDRHGIVSSLSRISRQANLASGIHVFPFAVISADSRISRDCLIYHHAIISHDVVIGENCIISNGAIISGACRIGGDTYIGAGSVIKERIVIGRGCIIAAGAVVFRDVPDNTIYITPSDQRENRYTDNCE